ncbi:MAG: Unknown protein [uncultured Sulfurovum sp.]|uniref:DUF2164 domain-containing protein n=1 Tax=uncultured Sulfurovum sp. TaxID=269237 RepID=A0A6S6S1V5_9BACT|nr:MAG: Unknown protein [uncultured Sulfurovum sp.]
MSQIEFTKDEKERLVQKLKHYFTNELDQDIGQFDAEFLLEFFSKEIGVYHYNKGLQDAQDIFKSRVDSMTDAIYELELPTEFSGK